MSEAVYRRLTEQLIEQMKNGVAPWQKPWTMTGANSPKNFITKKAYRGFNLIATASRGYECPYWLTFKQIMAMNGKIKPNSHGTPIVYWLKSNYTKEVEGSDETELKTFMSPRYYVVFNLEQVEGIDWEWPEESSMPEPTLMDDLIDIYCEEENIDLRMSDIDDSAYFAPMLDRIHVPLKTNFPNLNAYYATLFHEAVHSTGVSTRLNRGLDTQTSHFGSERYSKEELVAEFGSCFLLGIFGIDDPTIFDNSASYLSGWVKKLQDQPAMLVSAANQAQKAVDFITKINQENFDNSQLDGEE